RRALPALQLPLKHVAVVLVPLALEPFVRIVLQLLPEHVDEARMAGEELVAPGVPMVRQVIRPAERDHDVDQAPEGVGRMGETRRRVRVVTVEAHTRRTLTRAC